MAAFVLKSLATPESKLSLPVRVNILKSETGRKETKAVFFSSLKSVIDFQRLLKAGCVQI